jgi:hypothetical protein
MTRFSGDALVVRIPMRFQRGGDHKWIAAQMGSRSRRPQAATQRNRGQGARASMAVAAHAKASMPPLARSVNRHGGQETANLKEAKVRLDELEKAQCVPGARRWGRRPDGSPVVP